MNTPGNKGEGLETSENNNISATLERKTPRERLEQKLIERIKLAFDLESNPAEQKKPQPFYKSKFYSGEFVEAKVSNKDGLDFVEVRLEENQDFQTLNELDQEEYNKAIGFLNKAMSKEGMSEINHDKEEN